VLLRTPVFTTAVVTSLVLGIGANCAVFTVMNAVMFRPLPYPGDDRLVRLFTSNPAQGTEEAAASYPDFQDWQAQSHSFEHLAAYATGGTFLTGDGEAERVGAAGVTGEFFSTLGTSPLLGRTLTGADEQSGAVVIGYNLWQHRYGARRDILGHTITFNRRAATIAGIMPANFDYPQGTDLWTIGVATNMARGTRALGVIGRLRQGVRLSEAQAEMAGISSRLETAYRETNGGWQLRLVPLRELNARGSRPRLVLLLAGAMILLLTACANVGTLQLVRTAGRSQEIGVRYMLGASRARILRQLLVEGLVLSLTGTVIGLLIAIWCVHLLLRSGILSFTATPEAAVDFRVLGFALLTGIATTLAFALASPAYGSLAQTSEAGRIITPTVRVRRAHAWLVAGELSLVLVLLVTAVFLLTSFSRVLRVDLGFQPEHVLAGRIANFNGATRLDFFNGVIERLRTLPGIQDVAASYSLPLDPRSAFWHPVFVIPEGRPLVADQEINVAYDIISSNYFRTLRIPMRQGRPFGETDTKQSAPVAVINENLALRMWPDGRAVGRHITLWRDEDQPREVVGVVQDIKTQSPETPAQPEVYVPLAQATPSSVRILVRASGDPQGLIPEVRTAVRSIDANWPVYEIRTMEDIYATTLLQRRSQLVLLASFAAVALMLAALGVYGVFTFAAVSRSREIAIRMAVGASRAKVVGLMLRQALVPIGAGVILGNIFAVIVARAIRGSLFGIRITNAGFYMEATLLLGSVALICSLLPAIRASRSEPASVLRQE
jgi:putative ABC transport system permease protein